MKSRSIAIFIFLISACAEKDRECVAPALSNNIIGRWTAHLKSNEIAVSKVEFRMDGSYTESNGVLFSNYNNPAITWRVTGDTVSIIAKYPDLKTASYKFSLSENLCDKITLDLESFDQLRLTRN